MNLDNTSTSAALSGFIAGVVITVLSALVFIPAGGSGASLLAGAGPGSGGAEGGTGLFGVGGEDGEAGTGGEGGGGDGLGLFGGGGEASGDATAVGGEAGAGTGGSSGGTASGGAASGTASGGSSGGTTTTGGTTGGSTGGTATGGASGGSTGGTTTGGSTGGTATGGASGGSTGGTTGGTTGGSSGGGGQLACQPGANGGSTDTGITGDSILLGATVVKKGVGASFLGEATFAMDAVIRKVNSAGGICGRKIDIKYKNDDWDGAKGYQYIRDLVEADKVFALAVVPSSEGLNRASEAGYFQRSKVPVVGSDGMIRSQYTDPYIFPVATSTVSLMHVMADHAWNKLGARNFGLVFEKTYRFGVEGAYAFNQAYKRLGGNNIKDYEDPFGSPTCQSGTHFCAIAANQNDYSNENQNFNNGCRGNCDYVAYLMEPSTALQWFRSGGSPTPASGWDKGAGAAQPLFTYDFGANCGDPCNELWVWTGYNPPIEHFADQSGVRQYVNDLDSVNRNADAFNQFTEGAYLGMIAMVEAMAKTGPNLTREGMMDTLHNITVDVGLSQQLSWKPGDHLSNKSAQAFEISYKQGFKGWFFKQGYIQDRWAGQDMK